MHRGFRVAAMDTGAQQSLNDLRHASLFALLVQQRDKACVWGPVPGVDLDAQNYLSGRYTKLKRFKRTMT